MSHCIGGAYRLTKNDWWIYKGRWYITGLQSQIFSLHPEFTIGVRILDARKILFVSSLLFDSIISHDFYLNSKSVSLKYYTMRDLAWLFSWNMMPGIYWTLLIVYTEMPDSRTINISTSSINFHSCKSPLLSNKSLKIAFK